MAATETAERTSQVRANGQPERTHGDETKHALKTTEFFAMVGVIAAILIATALVSDSLNDVRAWTLIAAVAIGYMISRGLAKSGSEVRRRAKTRSTGTTTRNSTTSVTGGASVPPGRLFEGLSLGNTSNRRSTLERKGSRWLTSTSFPRD